MNPKLIDLYQKLCVLFGGEYESELSSEGKIEICPKDSKEQEKTPEKTLDIFDEHKALPYKSII